MKPILVALVGCLALAPTMLPAADGGSKPTPRVGDVLEYDRLATVECRRWEMKQLDKDGYHVSQCDDNLAYFDAATGRLVRIVTEDGDKLAQFKPALPSIDHPLTLGKTWSGKYEGYTNDNGALWAGDTDCKVEAQEKVEVAAGTFDAYRIVCQDEWEAGPFSGVSDTTSWYAPAVGAVVKTVNKQDSRWNSELQAYSRSE